MEGANIDIFISRVLGNINPKYSEDLIPKHMAYIQKIVDGKNVYPEGHDKRGADLDSDISQWLVKEYIIPAFGGKVVENEKDANIKYLLDMHPGLKNLSKTNIIIDDHHGFELIEEKEFCIIPDAPCAANILYTGILNLVKKYGGENFSEESLRELKKMHVGVSMAAVQDNAAEVFRDIPEEAERYITNLKNAGDVHTVLVKNNKPMEYRLRYLDMIEEAALLSEELLHISETPYEDFETALRYADIDQKFLKGIIGGGAKNENICRIREKIREKFNLKEIDELKKFRRTAYIARNNYIKIRDKISEDGHKLVGIVWDGAKSVGELGQGSATFWGQTNAEEVFLLSRFGGKNCLSERGSMEKKDFFDIIEQGEKEGAGGSKGRYGGTMKKNKKEDIKNVAVKNLIEKGFIIYHVEGDIDKEGSIKIEKYNI